MKIVFEILVTMLFASSALAEDSLIVQAKTLFAPERLQSNEQIMASPEYQAFLNAMRNSGTTDEARAATECAIDAMTSFNFAISTNEVDDGMSKTTIEDRGRMFCAAVRAFPLLREDTNLLARVVTYACSLKKVDFRHNLAHMNFGVAFGNEELKEDFAENMRSLESERRLQERVWDANAKVRALKGELLYRCGDALAGARDKLAKEDFAVFTNNLGRVGNFSFRRYYQLFRKVAPPEEFSQYIYAGRRGIICEYSSSSGGECHPLIEQQVESCWNVVINETPESGWKVSAEVVRKNENEALLEICVKARGEEFTNKIADAYMNAVEEYFGRSVNQMGIKTSLYSSGLSIDGDEQDCDW